MFEFPIWSVRLSVALIVVWAVALILSRLLRKAGIPPAEPFKSRQEYLAAALEMDLDLFLERASVTPRNVILKPKPGFEINCGNKGCPCQPSDVPKPELINPEPPFWDVSVTALGVIGGAGVAAGAFGAYGGMAAQRKAMGSFQAYPATRPRVGAYFRVRSTGALVRALLPLLPSGVGLYATNDRPEKVFGEDDLEFAYPHKGEWWAKKPCLKMHAIAKTIAWSTEPKVWAYTVSKGDLVYGCPWWPDAQAAECGCLEPVNFGKGVHENKSQA